MDNSLEIIRSSRMSQTQNETFGYIDFTTTTTYVSQEGRVQWDGVNGTIMVGLPGGVVQLQVGQEMNFRAKNNDSTTITDGSPVYIDSASAGTINIKRAVASDYTISKKTIGVATENILQNQHGFITVFGRVNDVSTTAWTDGAVLYLQDTPGLLSTALPASNNVVKVATVINSGSSSAGKLFVDVHETITKYGDVVGGNYSEFEADGTLKANGNATVINDLNGSAIALQQQGPGVSRNATENVVEFTGTANLSDYLYDNYQLRHSWKLGSTIRPHIHWKQTNNTAPNFLFRYRWQKNGGVTDSTWNDIRLTNLIFPYSTLGTNQISGSTAGITPDATAYNISDVLEIKIYRDNANNSGVFATTDVYPTTVGISFVDIHIEEDTLGSRTQFSK